MESILAVLIFIAIGLVLLRFVGVIFKLAITVGLILLIIYVINEAVAGYALPLLPFIR
ncbi:hypothetical protein [Salisediminibacterium halotolerans]|uniref:Uncharacterized protein n=1 Tax=Salisediminibacterium halotolerans TaxID=517425 RepID=A0A1H9WFH0_9BACI|nr:hypothetical protein [Salisediminibacterium haloalkalitolerans]SES32650.1 hypothetical protein SAMN05444126_13414 [Salisediminibacterium haloalkalitolerans]